MLPWRQEPLPYGFFARDTKIVAQELLGTYMAHFSPEGLTVGRVVETEAYLGRDDPACHSARGPTERNAVMFGPAGFLYVYLIYGMYYCVNVTTDRAEVPAAVLLRALEPVAGVELMRRRRSTSHDRQLCSGPGRLARAMGIDRNLNGESVVEGAVRFYPPLPGEARPDIVTAPRIGIREAADWPLRFYFKDNPYVSRR
ncbi:MAG: DNA-3-methyladenine glycosylase [Thermoanaerobacteraceae bacterium]|uniref:DNA-3-methyladenine glycosylase n=1 Tax=Thermanaeromonas sp. C210 TaxID=2731925 RepID=UPI00155C8B23|nr:DNA-3-methyladenine glycosylase [Thermanaeromonas sp. C210]MBE3580620.1 DNA-3-methyladenine glycosylase [Thermoanaerobacteraceae bacterium]GFN24204.1 putative 3-methyladenine DNA glycosylase [Thermanaeromonas sp. C210]